MYESEITTILDELDWSLEKRFVKSNSPIIPSLANGHPGVAMFYAYYYLFTNNNRHLENCNILVERSLQYISENEAPYTFCNGIAGIGWLVQLLIAEGIIDANENILNEYDEFLFKIGYQQLSLGNYDYFHGGLGCGIYMISRPNQEEYLSRLLEALKSTSYQDEAGCYWKDNFSKTSSDNLPPMVNFGLAHGMPSIVYFLSELVGMGIGGDGCLTSLAKSIKYMTYNADISKFAGSFFPSHMVLGDYEEEKLISRLAWCYGDLGVLASYFHAATTLNDKELFELSVKMALKSSERRNVHETLIVDGGICHGYAGVALLFNHFFSVTGDEIFKETSKYWLGELIKNIKQFKSITLYKEYNSGQGQFYYSYGFLTGSTGIGLVLLSFLESEIKTNWKKSLLLNSDLLFK